MLLQHNSTIYTNRLCTHLGNTPSFYMPLQIIFVHFIKNQYKQHLRQLNDLHELLSNVGYRLLILEQGLTIFNFLRKFYTSSNPSHVRTLQEICIIHSFHFDLASYTIMGTAKLLSNVSLPLMCLTHKTATIKVGYMKNSSQQRLQTLCSPCSVRYWLI